MGRAESAPEPPPDPRDAWSLPAFGALAAVEHLGAGLVRVLAPNPSPMTLDGTNTYVLSPPGSGEALVIDPGPEDARHRAQVAGVLAEVDAQPRAVVLTHHHHDHAEAAGGWARGHGCEILAASRELTRADRTLADGGSVPVGDTHIEVVATPGHTSDHLAFRLEDGAVLTGDHVLGRGTSVVVHPDGDLEAYLSSLRRLHDLGPHALYPGHGPPLTEDPTAVLEYYLAHRSYREAQLRAALTVAPATIEELVAQLYADVDRRLWPAAAASLSAMVAALTARGVVRTDAAGRCHLVA